MKSSASQPSAQPTVDGESYRPTDRPTPTPPHPPSWEITSQTPLECSLIWLLRFQVVATPPVYGLKPAFRNRIRVPGVRLGINYLFDVLTCFALRFQWIWWWWLWWFWFWRTDSKNDWLTMDSDWRWRRLDVQLMDRWRLVAISYRNTIIRCPFLAYIYNPGILSFNSFWCVK